MDDKTNLESLDNKLSILISLLMEKRDIPGEKPEIFLNRFGLKPAEISKILNKQVMAVHKALQRARKK